MTEKDLTKEEVLSALRGVKDPELDRDIVSLGMVRDVNLNGGNIQVRLEIAAPSPGLRNQIKAGALAVLEQAFPKVKDVEVEVGAPAKPGQPLQTKQSIPGIRHIIAVASGKGGVGKTTVAVNLALALKARGLKVGLMDGDIYGPNVPLMLGVDPAARPFTNDKEKIIPLEAQGLKMISMGVLVPADQPMVWRGPMLHSAVTQFLQKVEWGELDYLLVDLPPGTGDVQLSLVQTTPLSGAVIVTTPQEVALMDVRKGIAMFRKTEVPILGIIENMTGEVFGSGGGREAARQFQVNFLGEIPLNAEIRQGGDNGAPIVSSRPDSEGARGFCEAAEAVDQSMQQANL